MIKSVTTELRRLGKEVRETDKRFKEWKRIRDVLDEGIGNLSLDRSGGTNDEHTKPVFIFCDLQTAQGIVNVPMEKEYTGTVYDIPDEELLRRAVQASAARRRGKLRFAIVMHRFWLGSTYASQLCRWFGYDPDQHVRR